MLGDGRVVTWGSAESGGDFAKVQELLRCAQEESQCTPTEPPVIHFRVPFVKKKLRLT